MKLGIGLGPVKLIYSKPSSWYLSQLYSGMAALAAYQIFPETPERVWG